MLTKLKREASLTLYDPGGGGGFKSPPPPSDFLPSRIKFWSYNIVRWGLFPKNSLTSCGEKEFLIGGHDLAVKGVLKI